LLVPRRALLRRSLTLGASALLLASCAPAAPAAPASATPPTTGAAPATAVPRTGGTLRIGKPADIIPAGAPFLLSATNVHLFTLLYDTLVSYDPQLTARPRLATSWTWSDDARQLTLKLRPDVKFHTGRPFTSADARFNLEHLRDPAVGSQWQNDATLMHISTPDPSTLVIDYDAPVKSSFDVLAGTFMADSETLDQTNAGKGFVGTGPFRFQEWMPGDHFTVARNPDYWQPGKPYLDQVELRIVSDPLTALAMLSTGGIDWVSGVAGQDARRLQDDPAYRVILTNTGATFYYVGLDLTLPALGDPRVRQAFNFALNRSGMVEKALYGFGRSAAVVWPRHSPAYDASQDQSYAFDLGRARQLLDAAGWDPSTTVPLMLGRLIAVDVPMAQIYQADLARIGVKLDIQVLDDADFYGRLQKGAFGGAWMTSMAFMNLSPGTFLSSAFPVRLPNASHFTSQRYGDLIGQVTASTDDASLRTELHELTQIMLDESFILPIAEGAGPTTGPELTRAAVQNVAWDTFGLFAYEDVWLAQ
jgi:peptide/nickel transport system substrate-binding protein